MKALKKWLVLTLSVALLNSSIGSIHATEYCYDLAGCGYQECRSAPCLTPAIALAALALAAIIAVAVQNSHHDHSH